jgi:ketosteroid isomerase-like protein
MHNLPPSLSPETQSLRDAYAALNRNDIPAFLTIFDPQIERIEPGDLPQSEIYRGIEVVAAHFSKARAAWAEGSCEPQQFIATADRVIVIVHVHVRLNHETEWRDARVADAFTFRNGKAIYFRTFLDQRQALEWAGISVPQPPAREANAS